MSNFLFYGINEAGETVFSELLRECDRADLQTLAGARLEDWYAVEVWEGPMCLVRLRRAGAG